MLVFTAAQLVKRLLALIPPKGAHLTRFHGVFAPHSTLRSRVVRLSPGAQPAPPPSPAAATSAPPAESAKKRPRVDWAFLQRHTFEADVWRCPCGGRRRLLAVVTRRATAEEVLRHMGLGSARPPLATGHSLPSLPWPSDRSRGYARRKRPLPEAAPARLQLLKRALPSWEAPLWMTPISRSPDAARSGTHRNPALFFLCFPKA